MWWNCNVISWDGKYLLKGKNLFYEATNRQITYICGMGGKTKTSFKPGMSGYQAKHGMDAKPPGRPVGSVNSPDELTLIVKRHYKALADIFDEDGIQRLMDDIETLPMRDQVQAKLTLLEYVKPKLARLEVSERKEVEVISIFGQRVDAIGRVEDAKVVEDEGKKD